MPLAIMSNLYGWTSGLRIDHSPENTQGMVSTRQLSIKAPGPTSSTARHEAANRLNIPLKNNFQISSYLVRNYPITTQRNSYN